MHIKIFLKKRTASCRVGKDGWLWKELRKGGEQNKNTLYKSQNVYCIKF